jgi:hypothetical protein
MPSSHVVHTPYSNPHEKRSLFFDATSLLDDPAALRNRAEQDGYLFFKKFLPTEPLIELRRQMLEICAGYGWLDRGHDIMEGVIDEAAINQVPSEQIRTDIGVSEDAYRAVQKLELFHTLPHHPKFLSLYRNLFGKEAIPHPRHIARMITCHRDVFPTPPHQDFIHIQGTGIVHFIQSGLTRRMPKSSMRDGRFSKQIYAQNHLHREMLLEGFRYGKHMVGSANSIRCSAADRRSTFVDNRAAPSPF